MKRILVCGVISLFAASAALPVLADPPGDRRPPGAGKPAGPPSHGGPSHGGPSHGGPSHGGPSHGGPAHPGGGPPPRPSPPRPGGHPPSPRPPQNGHHHPAPAPGHNRPSPAPGHHRPSPTPGHRPGNPPGHSPIYGWNHHRLRLGQFRYPSGYAYRSWSVGQSLPQLLFGSAYYFTDYAALGLDSPPYGYQWVRYGPDVLLVNVRTGEILDVIHNAFY
jgi:Ni/Co efflux regulator RcnB